ncbi:oxidoreductase [Galbitalea sp. SE-J8]|uniref:FAD-dependent oxidoreductase n=1 Tax=Galbitalea sp. SE-J8 TaxID=3054952 RepID=UPI00259C6A86|nr:oxidoreductase [Galbitalea sp. SE-J8]MDM4761400.1 oxidoreductase [Galbitalea sp. SE-J8]
MMAGFDAVLGRIGVYRQVAIVLGAIAVVALVLAATGQLAYGWLQLLASLAVALVATIGSARLIALPFRARPHLDSSIITALLLFFILLPTVDPDQLAVVALAGVIASASKFLVAARGRHVLNPAATGALVVTVTGLTPSGWWVATPYLFPVVALGALVVLCRIRRLALGAGFVVVAAGLELVRFLPGSPAPDALGIVFLSLPLVFFAGFMLSEPLTLPPLRWQRLLVAVVVAALFAIPFSLGPLHSTPQLALVVGNVIGFAFGQRRAVRLEVVEQRELVPGTRELVFRPVRPVRFRPGQYVELDLPHRAPDVRGRRRVFSISSAPADGTITVAMTYRDPVSSFKRALFALEPGAVVRATGVAGDFALPADDTPVLLVAGGIGVTPFASQLAALPPGRDITVVYAASAAGLAYREVLERSGARVVVVAPAQPEALPPGWVYAGPARLSRATLAEHVPDAARRRAFVSGPPSFVADVRRELRAVGVRRITTDAFTGY